ncbi:PREDICTED: sialic acid-binding Ig-like lectin 16 [Chinchilla lanigera]|uniref:sialic acid-binding Ig-like lectin 16 n=1 Tax=Chinchilla lanigera TaxID=34839 RepID=UPI0006988685|nr:PREDICTED: sialic acid-binding Ig-like lectin 16 [Chinchilla lanigera]
MHVSPKIPFSYLYIHSEAAGQGHRGQNPGRSVQAPPPLPASMLLPALLLPALWAGSLQEEPSYWLQVQRLVTVQENLCVVVSCSFSYPQDGWSHSIPAYGCWYRQSRNSFFEYTADELVATNDPGKKAGMRTKPRFQLLGDPMAYNCSLRIAGAQRGDSGIYYFRLERGGMKYSYRRWMVTVIVTELTQTPDIHIPELLVSGHISLLLCSMPGACSGNSDPTFSWSGAALRSPGSGLGAHNSSQILLQPRPQDHGSHLTCQVTFPEAGVTKERTVQLNVSYPPQNLTIRVTSAHGTAPHMQGNGSYLQVHKDQLLRLLCAAESRPPATLTWVLEHRVLLGSPPSAPSPLRLELPGVQPADAGRYTCRAENSLGSQHRSLDLAVQYPPEDLRVTVSRANSTVLEILGNGTSLPVLEGQSLRLVCVTHSHPPARLRWARGTQALSPSWPSAPGVLELPRVQLEHEGEVSCHAENALGTRSVSLSLSVHWKPGCWWRALLAALGGAGLAALLALCACLVFPSPFRQEHVRTARTLRDRVCTALPSSLRVKPLRKQDRRTATARRGAPPAPGSVYKGKSYENWPGSLQCPPLAAGTAAVEEEQEEDEYTFVDFPEDCSTSGC